MYVRAYVCLWVCVRVRACVRAASGAVCMQALRKPLMAAVLSHLHHSALSQPWGIRIAAVQAIAKASTLTPTHSLTHSMFFAPTHPLDALSHPPCHSRTCLLTQSLVHSLYSLTQSLHSLTHSLHALTHSITLSTASLLMHSVTHHVALTHSLTHSLTYSLTHSHSHSPVFGLDAPPDLL